MYTESPSPFELVGLKIFLSYGNLQIFFSKKKKKRNFQTLKQSQEHESNKNDTQHLHLSLSFMSKFSIHEPT